MLRVASLLYAVLAEVKVTADRASGKRTTDERRRYTELSRRSNPSRHAQCTCRTNACLLETFAGDRAEPAALAPDSQVSVRLLPLRAGEELRCVSRLLPEQLQGAEVLPAQGTLHRVRPAGQPLVFRPHLHAGDVDVVATAEPARGEDGDMNAPCVGCGPIRGLTITQ